MSAEAATLATNEASPEATDEALRLFVGMDSVSELDRKEPLACVATFVVRYPLDLDVYLGGGEFEIRRVGNDEELCRWAESEFDHYEIRQL